MRRFFEQSALRRFLSALTFAVLLLGPLGLCCHEHDGDHPENHGKPAKVCIGLCFCHFSLTVADEPRSEARPVQSVQHRAHDEQIPRTLFLADIEHPPKFS